MASNPIYQQNGNHANGKAAVNNGNSLHKSSSSHFNGNVPQPNGYRVAPSAKIPTKAEIDYHLENFIMSRKIALNGGNELRIDDKNISLHLNNHNSFVASPYAQKPQFPNNLHFTETINESTIENRPKRPHSIAVSSPINLNNDLNIATLTRRQKITTPNIVTGGLNKITTTCSPINFNHFNGNSPSPGRFSLYTPPSPVAASEANGLQQKQPPNVPQRRSQSIPRQVMTQSFTAPVSGVQTLNRPRSLDRYNGFTTAAHSSPSGMKQSMTFHGQQQLQQACYQGEIYEEVGKKKDRPLSFAYGTVPEQVYLENQLRLYQEQLKNITESMKKYQEQARILSELKRQQSLDRRVPTSKSDSKLSQKLVADEAQTPSHQLRLFLDNIRSSIKEPSFEDEDEKAVAEVNKADEKINDPKTPSDQLRQFLDAIRHNQSIETHQRATEIPKAIPEENFEMKKSETFSEVTDNIKLLNQDLETFNDNSNETSSKDMDQILDGMALLLKTNSSMENKKNVSKVLQKCSEALKKTTEQIRQMNGNNCSSDDSSCSSTTPGSIREAVHNLLCRPNGFQIMDDRMVNTGFLPSKI